MRGLRYALCIGCVLVVSFFSASTALANHVGANCTISPNPVARGETVTASGSAAAAGIQTVRFLVQGMEVGTALTNVNGHFSVSDQVPDDAPTGTFNVTVQTVSSGENIPCGTVTITEAAADPDPQPVVDPDGTDPLDDDFPGFAGRTPRTPRLPGQARPAAVPTPIPRRATLPRTGSEAAHVGVLGTATLLTGLVLIEVARRRRLPAPAPAVALPILLGSLRSSATTSEGDLLLPYTHR